MFKRILLICTVLLSSYTYLYADNSEFHIDGVDLNTAKKNAEYYFKKGYAAEQDKDLETALKNYQQAFKLYPHSQEYSFFLSYLLRDQGRYKEALEVLEKSTHRTDSINLTLIDNFFTLSDLHLEMRNFDKAERYIGSIRKYTKIIEQKWGKDHDTQSIILNAHAQLARILFQRGLVIRAIGFYRNAKKKYLELPQDKYKEDVLVIKSGLCGAYMHTRHLMDGYKMCQEVLKEYVGDKNDDISDILYHIATFHYKQNDYVQAKNYFEKALHSERKSHRKSSFEGYIMRELAQTHQKLGNKEEAHSILKNALILLQSFFDNDHPDIKAMNIALNGGGRL